MCIYSLCSVYSRADIYEQSLFWYTSNTSAMAKCWEKYVQPLLDMKYKVELQYCLFNSLRILFKDVTFHVKHADMYKMAVSLGHCARFIVLVILYLNIY